ncbi:MAG: uracil-DNA glycosylase [Puniceicoccales bacterium]|jgi:DNA polymerase|nr:uracil-DNA glycosylase [Puniceicoccales bacterium]
MKDSSYSLLLQALQALKEFGQNEIYIGHDNWQFLSVMAEHSLASINSADKIPLTSCQDVPPTSSLSSGDKRPQWEELRAHVLGSQDFQKHLRPGKQLVFGVGNLDTDIFFCGEAPGADEEIQGIPFVGRAGQLLTKIILAMGLTREQVYISNIMNWRPEMPTEHGNRPPTQEEMEYCLPYLRAQVDIIRPKVIVALGATATNGLLGYDAQRRISLCRGQWYEFQNIPLMVTFHPSYLLRNQSQSTKRLVWEDMLETMKRVGMIISDKQAKYFL